MNIHEEEKFTKTYDAALMRRLLQYIRPYWTRVACAVILLFVASVLGIAGPYLTKIGIDKHIAHGDYAGLTKIALLYLGVLLLEFVFNYARMYMMEWIGQRTMYDLRLEIFSHLQYLPLRFFDRNQVGRLMTRVTSDVQALNEMFSSGLVAIFGDVFSLLGIIAVLFYMNVPLTLVTLGVVPLLFIATQIFKIKVRDAERQIRLRLAKINAFLQENITGMAVVQLFNREHKNFKQFDQRNLDHLEAYRRTIFYHAVFYPVVEWIFALSVALIIWYGGSKVIANTLTFGSLVAFILYMDRFWRPISDLAEKYGILQTAMASAERIFKLLDEPPERRTKGEESGADGKYASEQLTSGQPADLQTYKLANLQLARARGEIEFRNVIFGYRDDEMVLKNVSFKVEAGEKIAIVGATGSGKTTIISLLCHFYTPQQGQILLDGYDIQNLPLTALRRQIGLVLQDVFLFAGTIEENISLGNREISPERIRQAARDVNALRFIERLPGQFHEPVIERGNSLSVGQKQLLAFARALAYDPAILILDEATSSVDTETELLIQQALERLMENRTSLIIAHRLSTIQHVDRIIVLHKGQIREMGTHAELLALGGIYYRLYQLQFAMQERLRPTWTEQRVTL
ncbi:MAG: ABC transporter ATP-binding protein/permease [candidate division KSB1 bacterium]|nr:ABC transporter ATP-binding protein/permease [candidate division KSB1 bacterium]MDZ7368725.1 ABC transporter ATP-binding protein/permease [candidate division KSB1 bacterium]MDZ7406534.1 ABC transporter ATP-binding protein/permease [candidate division KSB1 bacterium]